MIIYLVILAVLIICVFIYWKLFFFYRDPERTIPKGNNIVSAADGTVVYVRQVDDLSVPISIKGKKEIKLEEIVKFGSLDKSPYYIVGVFMHPTDVHVNRSPISGTVKKIIYTRGKNLPMTLMWWRVLLGIKPYEFYSRHIIQNERNTIMIEGQLPVYVTQIADIYVSKIECRVKEGENLEKGQRIGMIKMGSQVDIIFPALPNIQVVAKEGQKIKAGEGIIAEII